MGPNDRDTASLAWVGARRSRAGSSRRTGRGYGGDVTGRQTIDELIATARSRFERLEPPVAAAALAAGALMIDTRCAELRASDGVIANSVHVPLSVLYWRLDPTWGCDDPALSDPDRQIVLICAHGFSSSLAAATLRDLGFNRATDVVGGFEAWMACGLPVEPLGMEVRVGSVAGSGEARTRSES